MRALNRSFATLLAATMVVSGLSFAPVSAEETEVTEPVATQEMVEMEQSGEVEAEETDADLSQAEVIEVSESFVAVPGEGVDGSSYEIVPISEATISEDVLTTFSITSMNSLVAALGAANVTVISGTEIKLLKNISLPADEDISYKFNFGTYVIDFNGYTVSGIVCFRMDSGSDVTFKDSTGSNTGGIISFPARVGNEVDYSKFPIDMSGGKATILSGKYAGYMTSIFALTGELRIEGGIIEPYSDDGMGSHTAIDVYPDMTNVEITGGLFRARFWAVQCSRDLFAKPDTSVRPPLRISGGTFVVKQKIDYNGAITYGDDNTGIIPDMNDLLADCCYIVPGDIIVYNITKYNDIVVSTGLSVTVEKPEEIINFVDRLYTKVLGRSPDPVGKSNWVLQLRNRYISGSQAAYGFFFSPELTNRNLSDVEFITLLYNVVLNRDPDGGGLQTWVSALQTGASRKYIFAGFANSQEWKALCAGYEIDPGSYTSDEPRDQNLKVTAFVQRLYSLCLSRSADVIGLNDWTGALVNKTKDGAHVAYGFFFSQEFIGRNLSNADYVEVLYQVLLGRGSDPVGRANWVAQLSSGKSRLEIFKGFVHSAEFDSICASYGILRGSI